MFFTFLVYKNAIIKHIDVKIDIVSCMFEHPLFCSYGLDGTTRRM